MKWASALNLLKSIGLFALCWAPLKASAGLYDIEIVVFTRLSSTAGDTEFWPPDPGSPDWSDAVNLNPDGGSAAASATNRFDFHPPSSGGPIDAAQTALRYSQDFRPIFATAWRQEVESRRDARPLYISSANPWTGQSAQSAEIPPPQLEGTVTISAGKYLHADIDLLLNADASSPAERWPAPPQAASLTERPYKQYRMISHRRMRSGELHYLDHPLIGVLLYARPVSRPAQTDESVATQPGSVQEQ